VRQPLTRATPLAAPVEPLPRISSAGARVDTPPRVASERRTPSGWQPVKRGVDVSVSLIALIALSPVMACLALLTKLESRGPALFVQERVGQDGKIFTLLKFRSMRVDAEVRSGPVFAKPNDPRCTRTGRFMRRYSLDELPQLINVLRGDMSLVGPRPERPYFVAQFSQSIPRYHDRHRVKSGITGWAQVNGLRGDTSIDERTRYDLHYVEHWSPSLDIQIMLRTIIEILQGHNAY
jgi:exopolysaccharide biosynthesis polyprenyl glycosylphosphotransferase